jgi:hypothetical protein
MARRRGRGVAGWVWRAAVRSGAVGGRALSTALARAVLPVQCAPSGRSPGSVDQAPPARQSAAPAPAGAPGTSAAPRRNADCALVSEQ